MFQCSHVFPIMFVVAVFSYFCFVCLKLPPAAASAPAALRFMAGKPLPKETSIPRFPGKPQGFEPKCMHNAHHLYIHVGSIIKHGRFPPVFFVCTSQASALLQLILAWQTQPSFPKRFSWFDFDECQDSFSETSRRTKISASALLDAMHRTIYSKTFICTCAFMVSLCVSKMKLSIYIGTTGSCRTW